MTTNATETRKAIDNVVAALVEAGHTDAASFLELAREFTLNPAFRKALQDSTFAATYINA